VRQIGWRKPQARTRRIHILDKLVSAALAGGRYCADAGSGVPRSKQGGALLRVHEQKSIHSSKLVLPGRPRWNPYGHGSDLTPEDQVKRQGTAGSRIWLCLP
jgi:hypothetical protein